jgi:peptide/nickel transport system substrate-binding protein
MGNHHNTSRRNVLRKTGAAVGTGVVAGFAGCSGGSGGSSSSNSNQSNGASGKKVREIELIVTTASYDPIRNEFGKLIADNWRKLGVDVKVNPTAWNTIASQCLVNQNFDTFTLLWAGRAERIDPNHFTYSIFHSSQTNKGAYNFVNYTNPNYDKYAEKQQRLYDVKKRQDPVYKCQKIAMRDQPHAPIANKDSIMPYNSVRFKNPKPMMGEGLMSFWNMIGVEPTEGVTTLRLGYPSGINSINPLNVQATHDAQTLRLIYDRLFRIDRDGTPKPWAAKTANKVDNKTFDVPLRQGMKWHDGKDVTAEDVRFSYDYISKNSPKLSQYTEPIKSVETVGKSTIRFNLKRPYSPFIANTLGIVFILPKHIWKNVPEGVNVKNPTQWSNPEVIGSGPFKFDSWRRQEQMRLKANKAHFRPPNIDTLLKVPGSSMQTLVRQIQNKQIDMIGWVPQPKTQKTLKQSRHLSLSVKPSHGLYHINFKCNEKPFTDPAFRRALSHAIPRQLIVDSLLKGKGATAYSQIVEVNKKWHASNVPKYQFGMEKARKQLQNAGYTLDSNGKLRHPA